jgi:hypothetical protein
VVLQTALATGCGGLLLSGSDTSSITFQAGELRSDEEIPLVELDLACRDAVEILGYEEIEITREEGRILLTARTARGEPVELQLARRVPGERNFGFGSAFSATRRGRALYWSKSINRSELARG